MPTREVRIALEDIFGPADSAGMFPELPSLMVDTLVRQRLVAADFSFGWTAGRIGRHRDGDAMVYTQSQSESIEASMTDFGYLTVSSYVPPSTRVRVSEAALVPFSPVTKRCYAALVAPTGD